MDSPVVCEVKKSLKGIEFFENIEGIDEWPHQAPDEISYRINRFSPDMSERWQKKAVTISLRMWRLRLDRIRFRRERNPDVSVYANISFEPPHKFSSDNVLAHAFFPGQGEISGEVEINDKWDWVPGSFMQDLAHPPLVPIMGHEFGHSIIGLRHDTLSSSMHTELMYPSFNFGRRKNQLGPRTMQRGQDRFGVRNLPNRWILYFLRRRSNGWDFR